jgi:WD40 repeat protein
MAQLLGAFQHDIHHIFDREINKKAASFSLGYSFGNIRSVSRILELHSHRGCVNTARWDPTGSFLVSGSDDRTVKIWDFRKNLNDAKLVHTVRTSHRSNIFCAEMSPIDQNIVVSCSADGTLYRNAVNTRFTETRLMTSESLM